MADTDTLLSKSFKLATSNDRSPGAKEKANDAFRAAEEALRTPEAREAARELWEFLRQGSDDSELSVPLHAISTLSKSRLLKSAEFALIKCLPHLGAVDPGKVLTSAPTRKSLDAYLKQMPSELAPKWEKQADENPTKACGSALADWRLNRFSVKDLPEAAVFIAAIDPQRISGPKLPGLIASVLNKDRDARCLAKLLDLISDQPQTRSALLDAVQSEPGLLDTTLAAAPQGLATAKNETFGDFLKEVLLAGALKAPLKERRTWCGQLLRLAGEIVVRGDRNPHTSAFLISLSQLSERLGGDVTDDGQDFWVFQPPGKQPKREEGQAKIFPSGAQHIAVAFEHVEQGLSSRQILEVAAKNLGFEQIGERGKPTNYRPLEHEDREGGLLPGDSVEIVHPGWSFDGEELVRAVVKGI